MQKKNCNYAIITKNRVFENSQEDIVAEQSEKMKIFGISNDKEYVCHFFGSRFFNESMEIMDIQSAIERLAIKDGVDMVQYSNGNIGFIAYYNDHKNGFEIIG